MKTEREREGEKYEYYVPTKRPTLAWQNKWKVSDRERACVCLCLCEEGQLPWANKNRARPGRAGTGRTRLCVTVPSLFGGTKKEKGVIGRLLCINSQIRKCVCVCMLKKRFWLSSPTSVRSPVSRPALLNAREKERVGMLLTQQQQHGQDEKTRPIKNEMLLL